MKPEAGRSRGDQHGAVLVERLEREHPGGPAADELSVPEPIAWPIGPADRRRAHAPKTMNTAIPLAVAVRNTEPSNEIATTIETADGELERRRATIRSGHQSPISPVTSSRGVEDRRRRARRRQRRRGGGRAGAASGSTGRTSSGWSSPRSASPRTTPSVRKTPARRRGTWWRTSRGRRWSRRRRVSARSRQADGCRRSCGRLARRRDRKGRRRPPSARGRR